MKHNVELLKRFAEIWQTSKEGAKTASFNVDYIALKLSYLASKPCKLSYCFYSEQQSKIKNA
jgi:hypothetical protein